MATYKVIQDIEAEDKLLLWMSPRQAIYAAIVVITLFIGFMLATRAAWWLALPLIPHTILFAVLAGPFVHDQPPEVWLLAKIQFSLKPRIRVWDQSGLKELVKITVPKRIVVQRTDGLSQGEVKSRLEALANTIDSRGWAVKNVNVNLYAQPGYALAGSDRLIDTGSFPQEVPYYEVTPQDDILDERSNPTAQHLQQMITQSSQAYRQQLQAQMQQPAATATNDYWFMNDQPQSQLPQVQSNPVADNPVSTYVSGAATQIQPVQSAQPTADQEAFIKKLSRDKEIANSSNAHLRTIRPTHDVPKSAKKAHAKKHSDQPEQTEKATNPAVLELAANDDLNVATIARQANKVNPPQNSGDNEVVISLR